MDRSTAYTPLSGDEMTALVNSVVDALSTLPDNASQEEERQAGQPLIVEVERAIAAGDIEPFMSILVADMMGLIAELTSGTRLDDELYDELENGEIIKGVVGSIRSQDEKALVDIMKKYATEKNIEVSQVAAARLLLIVAVTFTKIKNTHV